MRINEINFPYYNLDKIGKSANTSPKTEYYGLKNIPCDYIEGSPDFQKTADTLRDYLRENYPNRELCIRGISMSEHNRINHTNLCADDLIGIISKIGHDRYRPDINGQGYENEQNKKIDFFAYDVFPCIDDSDLIYFFMSFYYFGISNHGEPSLLDIITVYDRTKLNMIEHTYKGSNDIKRDGFTFKNENKHGSVLEILKIIR